MHKIVVTGERVGSKKFEIIFDMLDDGVEAGKIEYIKHDMSSKTSLPEADGYIFIITRPWGDKDNYIHILPSDGEDAIIQKVQSLGDKLNGKKIDNNIAVDTGSDVLTNQGDVRGDTILHNSTLLGLVLDINGKEVNLNKDDMESFREMMRFCSEFGYKIKEVICE